MSFKFRLLASYPVLAALGLATQVQAATPPMVVEAVQAPAVVIRATQALPLIPGMALKSGDQVSTGEGGRALLRLAEGSSLKLGESAKVNVYSTGTKPRRFYRGALDVQAGSFHFDSTQRQASNRKRDLKIRVGAVTIGLQGAVDLVGQNGKELDQAALLAGQVEVRHPLVSDLIELNQPMQLIEVGKGETPESAGELGDDQLKQLTEATEVSKGGGLLASGGHSLLRVGTPVNNQTDALDLYDRARSAGFPVRIWVKEATAGNYAYQVVLAGVASRKDAATLAQRMQQALETPVSVAR